VWPKDGERVHSSSADPLCDCHFCCKAAGRNTNQASKGTADPRDDTAVETVPLFHSHARITTVPRLTFSPRLNLSFQPNSPLSFPLDQTSMTLSFSLQRRLVFYCIYKHLPRFLLVSAAYRLITRFLTICPSSTRCWDTY
jgi:hypothetical protein